jgi:hypothetical protein
MHLTMANPVAFLVLLMYICSAHVLLSWGNFWSPGMLLSSHSQLTQLSGYRPLFIAVCWHTNNQSNTTAASQNVPKKHIRKKPILPTSTIKMEGGDVLQGHHIRGRAVSHNAFIILHSQQRNWYLYHNITTKLLWKKHNISTKMIPLVLIVLSSSTTTISSMAGGG